jgi:AraC-like DNA-binding protein
MSLPIADMEALGAAFGRDFKPPQNSVIVTPDRAAMTRLQKIHAMAGELAEHAPDVIAVPEAARGLEQALLDATARCLIARDGEGTQTRRHHEIMKRFYAVLEAHPESVLHTLDLCKATGVSNRTLTTCCNETLGMSPSRFLKLRQMHLVRRALRRADPLTTTVTVIATDHGFWDMGRFANAYRNLFGELPSAALRRRPDGSPDALEHENLMLASEIT